MCLANRFLGSQSTRYGATTQDIVDQCVDFQIRYLPLETSSITTYIPMGSTINPSHLFDIPLIDKEFDYLNSAFRRDHPAFFKNVKNIPWTIIPVSIVGNVCVVVIHSRLVQDPTKRRGWVVQIENIMVADPLKREMLEFFIFRRFKLILNEKRGFKFECNGPVDFWFPREGCERHNHGLRVYEIIRIMIERISQSVSEEVLKDGVNLSAIWRELSGMFFQIHSPPAFLNAYSSLYNMACPNHLACGGEPMRGIFPA